MSPDREGGSVTKDFDPNDAEHCEWRRQIEALVAKALPQVDHLDLTRITDEVVDLVETERVKAS